MPVEGDEKLFVADFGWLLPLSEKKSASAACRACTMKPTARTMWSTVEPMETMQTYFIRCNNPFSGADQTKQVVMIGLRDGAKWIVAEGVEATNITGWIKVEFPTISLQNSPWKHPLRAGDNCPPDETDEKQTQ